MGEEGVMEYCPVCGFKRCCVRVDDRGCICSPKVKEAVTRTLNTVDVRLTHKPMPLLKKQRIVAWGDME